MKYLTDIPTFYNDFGFSKVLAVRYDVIYIKHIFTEIFVKKTINIQKYLDDLEISLFDYMEHMTNRLRKIHHFSREYKKDLNEIVKSSRDRFFPILELYSGLNNLIVLDFDGVVTENSFKQLYDLCLERNKTVICSANPTLTEDWFNKREYNIPNKIHSCKGKIKKIKCLIELQKKYDHIFYIDNEDMYLEFAWIFGINTFKYTNGKIEFFTMLKK